MTLPNLISVLRLLLVPVIVGLILNGEWPAAFWLFVVAGVSDAVDGLIARRWNLQSQLGAHLDPLADKALLVSIYVSLAWTGGLADWLVLMVVGRDALIVGAVVLSWMMARPLAMRPRMVSKANTVAQIVLAAIVLGQHGLGLDAGSAVSIAVACVAGLTAASMAVYLADWMRHLRPAAARPPGDAIAAARAGGTGR